MDKCLESASTIDSARGTCSSPSKPNLGNTRDGCISSSPIHILTWEAEGSSLDFILKRKNRKVTVQVIGLS